MQKFRNAKGWGQAELAKHAKIGHQTVHRLEKGTQVPRQDNINAIAKALGVDPGELLVVPGSPLNIPQDILEALSEAGDFELEAVRAVLGIRKKAGKEKGDVG